MIDPRFIELQQILSRQPAKAVQRSDKAKEAAVALLVRPGEQLELLLIKRAAHDADPWSGHVALPGGRRAARDVDLLQTAQREAEEEVGIPVRKIGELVGALDEVAPVSPRLPPLIIAPYVFAIPPATTTTIDTREVEAAIWVPLSALRDVNAVSEILIELEGGSRAYPSLRYGEYVIWGLTHRILTQFLELSLGL